MKASEEDNERRLKNLVHSLGTKCALHQVTNGDGTNKGSQARILALFFCSPLLENLGWHKRLQGGKRSVSQFDLWIEGGGC